MTAGSPAESIGFSDLLPRGREEAFREEGTGQWITKDGLQPGLPKGAPDQQHALPGAC